MYGLRRVIPADRDEALIKNVIELFCTENLAEASGHRKHFLSI